MGPRGIELNFKTLENQNKGFEELPNSIRMQVKFCGQRQNGIETLGRGGVDKGDGPDGPDGLSGLCWSLNSCGDRAIEQTAGILCLTGGVNCLPSPPQSE